jgi:serine/threonine protein kinase
MDDPAMKIKFRPEIAYGKVVKALGKGSYGEVYQVERSIDAATTASYAIKTFTGDYSDGVRTDIMREIAILAKINHPNIVGLIDIINFTSQDIGTPIKMVLELAKSSLGDFIKTNRQRHQLMKAYMYQLSRGLLFLHDHDIWHRDIKPDNILIYENGKAVLSDFGISRYGALPNRDYTNEVETLWWRAPEIMLGADSYGPAIDVFGLGATFMDLLRADGMYTFGFQTFEEVLTKQISVLGHFVEDDWRGVTGMQYFQDHPNIKAYAAARRHDKFAREFNPPLKEESLSILKRMTYPNPSNRATIREIVSDPYFDDIRGTVDVSLPFNYHTDKICGRQLDEELKNNDVTLLDYSRYTITLDMFTRLFDWLIEVWLESGLKPETILHARILFDLYITKLAQIDDRASVLYNKGKLQLVGATCLYISSNIYDIYPLYSGRLTYLSDNTFNRDEVLRCQLDILKTVKFDLLYAMPEEYFYYIGLDFNSVLQDAKDLSVLYCLTNRPINVKALSYGIGEIISSCTGDIRLTTKYCIGEGSKLMANDIIQSILTMKEKPSYKIIVLKNPQLRQILTEWPNCTFRTPEEVKRMEERMSIDLIEKFGSLAINQQKGDYKSDSELNFFLTAQEAGHKPTRDEIGSFIIEILVSRAASEYIPRQLDDRFVVNKDIINALANYLNLVKGVDNLYRSSKILPKSIELKLGRFEKPPRIPSPVQPPPPYIYKIAVRLNFTQAPLAIFGELDSLVDYIGNYPIETSNGKLMGVLEYDL